MKSWESLLLSIAMITNTSFAIPQIVDKVVAIVNNNIVLESDINSLIRSVKLDAMRTNRQLPNDFMLRHQILERLIIDQIILQISQKIGVKITDEQLNQTIANIAKQNNITIDQMRNYLAHDGISYTTYRNQVYKEMLISEVYNNEVRRRVNILPQEVDDLVKQISNQNNSSTKLNISYIFIPLLKDSTVDQIFKAEIQAHSLIEQLRNCNNFNKFVNTNNIANKQVLKSGQIGWRRIQELPLTFAQMLSTAKKGDIVGPIRSSDGFYILKVNDLRSRNQSIFITEMLVRHILLKTSPIMTDNQARAKLEQIASDIKNGKITFSNAAKEFSQDPNSANHNGDLGWVTADFYDPTFHETLMHLNKGQLSTPVHSQFGWHLIELLDTRSVDKTNAVQKDRAYCMLFDRKFLEEATTWIQEQRACAYVKILDN